MGRLDTVIRENRDLKDELEKLITIVRENEAKHGGFRIVEYAFLLSSSLAEITEKPLSYLSEIFDIDRAVLFLNSDVLDFERKTDNLADKIFFHPEKIFKYFFLEKRPYSGKDTMNIISEFRVEEEIGSYLIAPITENGKIIAALALFSRDPERFEDSGSMDFVKELSFVVMVALKKLHNTEIIYRQARTDFLTGVYNKMAMAELIGAQINRHQRYGKGFYFIMADIDNFKAVNDKEGHLVGDNLLVDLCRGFREKLRASDILGRFGGDEFFIIIPEDDKVDIKAVCAKLTGVASQVFEKTGYAGIAGISGGVVAVPKDFPEGAESVGIVKLADSRLYESKKNGKNRFTGIES
ncbi:sensor domain-containing diguanylate cyclase [Geovibrio thiophilus]|uniref:diguanylate cyclase n=1 Tax=Geovibrio thiophilus TaxID=139438 RepID=A0A410JVL7_9BACT|nr:sensor domain-containing diguanylate cyclase [Geovibrio thiophilus]QAR32213.1 sensor domain-containing diguanylate cyclase [Geovibrio thiophilus]